MLLLLLSLLLADSALLAWIGYRMWRDNGCVDDTDGPSVYLTPWELEPINDPRVRALLESLPDGQLDPGALVEDTS